jgi:predicted component of type VI protein secretion system
MAVIQYSDRPHRGKIVPLGADAVTIGRRSDCQIRIDDRSIRRRHAEIFRQDDCYWIRALKGDELFVDGNAVHSHRLRHLDKVRCGCVILEYFEE